MRRAIRSLLKSPGFTAVALLTLALGIGLNTTAFSVLNALLHHPLSYPEPDALVRLYRTKLRESGRGSSVHSPANFLDYQSRIGGFAHTAAYQYRNFNAAEPGQPAAQWRGMLVTADFFATVGVAPELGRAFSAAEDSPGGNRVVLLSHATWLQYFGADPSVVGRSVHIDHESVVVVGVMPAAYDDYMAWGDVDAWRPIALSDSARLDRDNNYLNVIARIKSGTSLKQTQAEATALAGQLASDFPRYNALAGLNLMTLASSIQDESGRHVTQLILGLTGFVLLIACANLANLQLARNAARQREHAIRAALGASRGRLMREALQESILLTMGGGLLGLIVALAGNYFLGRIFPWGDHVGVDLPIDPPVLAFSFAATLLTGLLFGVGPAWIASRANVNETLQQGGRNATASRKQHRVYHTLIIAEVAMAVVLLAGAGFFRDGLRVLTQRDPGWRTENLITGYLSLRGQTYADPAARNGFFRGLQDRLAAIPGVETVAIASSLPTFGFSNSISFVVEGQPEPAPGQALSTAEADVSPDFFSTLGMRLTEGRTFSENDRLETTPIAIISESMARQFWPHESPIGKRIGGASPFMAKPRVVVGVVSNVRSVGLLGDRSGGFSLYHPLSQRPPSNATIAIRARASAEAITPDIRRVVAELDSDLAIYRISTVEQDAHRSMASMDVAGWSLVAIAGLGLVLAAIGIYGVIAHSVTQRTHEFGIRLALGAQLRDIFALVVGGGLRLAFFGAVVGLAGAFGVSELLRAIAAEFSNVNPFVPIGVTLLLGAVAILACWLPALRATRVDPMTALRAE